VGTGSSKRRFGSNLRKLVSPLAKGQIPRREDSRQLSVVSGIQPSAQKALGLLLVSGGCRTHQNAEVGRRKMEPPVLRGLPLDIDASLTKNNHRHSSSSEMLNRIAAHHSEMGNLLSLDVSIHQQRTDTKKARGSRHIPALRSLESHAD
jgi:hypothetical protein